MDKLTHENALLKRMKFAAQSERFNPGQKGLLEDEIEADLAAVASGDRCAGRRAQAPAKVEREESAQADAPLPANLPRQRDSPRARVHHLRLRLPDEARGRGRGREAGLRARRVHRGAPHPRQVGLRPVRDHSPGTVHAHVIDKGIPTTGLLAQVLVAKYADHLPLYRQESDLRRAPGWPYPALHAGSMGRRLRRAVAATGGCAQGRDAAATACCMPMRRRWRCSSPARSKTHRAYLWAYCPRACSRDTKAVVYDFCESALGRTRPALPGSGPTRPWKRQPDL